MAALLIGASAEGPGTGASLTGQSTIYVDDDSVFDGCQVIIEVSHVDTDAKYVNTGKHFFKPGAVVLNIVGDYYVRAFIYNARTDTSINCSAIQ